MSDPARPVDGTDEAMSPFPSGYGSLEAGQTEPAEATPPRPRGLARAMQERQAASAERETKPSRRRGWRPGKSSGAAGPVVATAGAGAQSPSRPVARAADLSDGPTVRSGLDSGPATAPRPVVARPTVPLPSAPVLEPETRVEPRRRGLQPDPEAKVDPRRTAPRRVLPEAVARQVGRNYSPEEGEVVVARHHWWRIRRKVTVVRARSSRRLVRRLDTWTVFKVSLIFYALALVIVLVAGIISWRVAIQVGFVNDIQKAVRSLADDTKFQLHGKIVLKYCAIGGAVLALAGTLLNVVACMLYNLISDIFGGVQLVVVKEPD